MSPSRPQRLRSPYFAPMRALEREFGVHFDTPPPGRAYTNAMNSLGVYAQNGRYLGTLHSEGTQYADGELRAKVTRLLQVIAPPTRAALRALEPELDAFFSEPPRSFMTGKPNELGVYRADADGQEWFVGVVTSDGPSYAEGELEAKVRALTLTPA